MKSQAASWEAFLEDDRLVKAYLGSLKAQNGRWRWT